MKVIKTDVKYTVEERETHVWFDYENKQWILETNVPKHINRAVKYGWECTTQWVNDGLVVRAEFIAGERGISIKSDKKRGSGNAASLDAYRKSLEDDDDEE